MSLSWALLRRRLVRRAGVRLVVVLLHLARPRMLWVVRVVVWRRQALGRMGVMLFSECGQQRWCANNCKWQRLGRLGAGTNKRAVQGTRGIRYKLKLKPKAGMRGRAE